LLPFFEEQQLHNLLDYSTPPLNFGTFSGAANATAANTRIPIFLCPSDQGEVPKLSFGPNNYVACTGTGTIGYGHLRTGGDGVFFDSSKIAFRQITDGSSHTVAFSESLLGNNVPSSGTVPSDASLHVIELTGGSDTTPMACQAGIGVWSSVRGAKWINGHYGDTLYNHYYLPNAAEWDCGNGSHNKALTSARSRHPEGVHVMYCDGHVDFVLDSVDLAVWRATATRSADELITN
jgi:prepilin-type processing-associated H-X9-DG protein